MLSQLAADFSVPSFEGVPIIGDKVSDLELARAVGARGILVLTGKGSSTAAALRENADADADADAEIYKDLAAAVDAVLARSHS
jgi:D-glycero-D-manno-heptose 1,7-bisphosphate phosphatase